MVWLLLVWESFVVETRGIATTTISANIRKGYVHLFAKRIISHDYVLTNTVFSKAWQLLA